MSNQIERLRYYDGEYLRSYDFVDEQAYHVEMRRRLNHRLHLHGIVYGLEIEPDQDSVPGAIFYSISHGMAIDQQGREIYIPAPYSLSNPSLFNHPWIKGGDFEVWLCYQETQTGLPAAGYRDCNETNQQTRWQEGFQVVLKPVNPAPGSPVPHDCGGVRLGTVTVDNVSGWQISSSPAPNSVGRTYVGIRAQRVIVPDEEADTFKMDKQNVDPTHRAPLPGYLDIEPGVFSRGNLIVEKNVVIGDDFPGATDPVLPISPPGTGNLKITSDLFLKGDFYGVVGGKWFLLKDYIQTLTPVVMAGTATIPITAPGSVPSPPLAHGTVSVSVDSKLPQVTKPPTILVALNEIDWVDPVTLHETWLQSTDPNAKKPFTVSVNGPSAPPAPASSITFSISATIGPVVLDSASAVQVPITSVSVSYMVVFTP